MLRCCTLFFSPFCMQVERLSWHPCIAVWCGNNELELSYEWPNNTVIRSNRNMYVNDYLANIVTLRDSIKKASSCQSYGTTWCSNTAPRHPSDVFVPLLRVLLAMLLAVQAKRLYAAAISGLYLSCCST